MPSQVPPRRSLAIVVLGVLSLLGVANAQPAPTPASAQASRDAFANAQLKAFQQAQPQAIQPPPRDAAQKKIAPTKDPSALGGVSLGMTRDEVIAACTVANALPIREERSVAPEGRARRPVAPTDTVRGKPYLGTISCGPMDKQVRAQFAPPPGKQVVFVVHQVLMPRAGPQPVGSPSQLLDSLMRAYGKPATKKTELLPPNGQADQYLWLFKQKPTDIACVVPVPGRLGGQVLAPGIPDGGPCATHITARIFGEGETLVEARLTLMNADRYVAAKDAQIHTANLEGAGLREGAAYAEFSANVARAGLETREMREARTAREAREARAREIREATPPPKPKEMPGQPEYDATMARIRCKENCTADTNWCLRDEEPGTCSNRMASERTACQSRCK